MSTVAFGICGILVVSAAAKAALGMDFLKLSHESVTISAWLDAFADSLSQI